jgi:addiction module RelB/DinJ family antitoxin
MNTASIFIKTEPKIKEEAKKTAEELGFSLSSILNAFLRQFVKTKTITFSAKELDEIPNEYFQQALKRAREQREQGKASPVFHTAKEMIAWLHKQDI